MMSAGRSRILRIRSLPPLPRICRGWPRVARQPYGPSRRSTGSGISCASHLIPADEALSPPDLRTALGELRIYEAELEIQNEELLDSRARIEESQRKYFRHFDLAPVGLIRLNLKGQILEANILGAQMLDETRTLLNTVPRTFFAHVSPESHVVFQQHLESALASGKMETCELSLRNTAGQETFVRIQSVVSHSENDE